MKSALWFGCVALSLGIVAGCRTSVNTVENADKEGSRQTVKDKRVVTDESMKNRVDVTDIIERTLDSGFKQIQVEFTNRRNSDVKVFYAVEWFDEDGMIVPSASANWTEVSFVARDSKSVRFTAPTATAKNFRIKLVNKK